MKVKVTVVREIETEIDDKFEVLNCDIIEYEKRFKSGEINEQIIEDCIAEVENKTGIKSYDDNLDEHTEESFTLVETKDNSILEL